MLDTPFSPWPCYTEEEAIAVQRVLLSNRVNYWTGTEIRAFEDAFAAWVGVEYAIALMNGTVALELALKALGIGPGDEVIVTSRTFLASVSCIVTVGAIPVFADVDRDSQTITAESIQAVMSPKTKAIICVHLAGWPCDMDPIMQLAEVNQLKVIEDCAQAHGSLYKGRPVGSIGHVGAWSFCQDKIMTTGGEGGMVTTNDMRLWQWMGSYKDHGKAWDVAFDPKQPPTAPRVHERFGTNWRMTEIQAAIGRIQLARMPTWHAVRLRYAKQIWAVAETCPWLRVPVIPDYIEHAAYKCYVFVVPERLPAGWDRDRIISWIRSHDVPCYVGSSSEVYLEKAFDHTPYRPSNRLPVARELGEQSLMFLVHPSLSSAEMLKTSQVLMDLSRLFC